MQHDPSLLDFRKHSGSGLQLLAAAKTKRPGRVVPGLVSCKRLSGLSFRLPVARCHARSGAPAFRATDAGDSAETGHVRELSVMVRNWQEEKRRFLFSSLRIRGNRAS